MLWFKTGFYEASSQRAIAFFEKTLVIGTVLAVLGLFSGFSFSSFLLTVFFLCTQWWLGAELVRGILRRNLEILEVLAYGGIVGLLWTTTVNETLIQLRISSRLTISFVFIAASLFAIARKRKAESGILRLENAQLTLPISAVALTAVAPGLTWPTLTGVSLLLLHFCSQTVKPNTRLPGWKKVSGVLASLSTFASLFYLFFDKSWNGPRDQDTQYFEAMGVLIARFGADAGSPTLAEASISKYHWLASAWVGMINNLTDASPFLVQYQTLTFVMVVILVSSVILIVKTLGASPTVYGFVAVISLGIGGTEIVYYSQPLSIATFTAFLAFCLTVFPEGKSNARKFIVSLGLFQFGLIAIFAKGMALPLILGVAIAVGLTHVRKRKDFHVFLYQAGFCGALVVVFAWKYLPSQYSGALTATPLQSVRGFGISEGLWQVRSTFFSVVLLTVLTLLLAWTKHEISRVGGFANNSLEQRGSNLLEISQVIVVLLVIGIWLVEDSGAVFGVVSNGLFFAQLSLTCLSLSVLTRQAPSSNQTILRLTWAYSLAVGAFSAIFFRSSIWLESLTSSIWQSRVGGSRVGRWGVHALINQTGPIIAALAALALIVVYRRTEARLFVFITVFSLVSATHSTSTVLIREFEYRRNLTNSEVMNSFQEDINLPAIRSNEIIELGRLVRSNTEIESLFATNNFCCKGASWLSVPTNTFWRAKFGGANYQLGAETQRRFLIQGPLFGGAPYRTPPRLSQEEENRLRLSLSFANSPTNSNLRDLKTYGVQYFIVNLSLTDVRDWRKFGDELFRGSEFLLIRLH